MLQLMSLTYTSVARPGLEPADVRDIHQTARHLNALDGVTGLLVYNGHKFLQVIEGAENAIDDLLQRLQADPRHVSLTVENRRIIERREFQHWAMELAEIGIGDDKAQSDLSALLPATFPAAIRAQIVELLQTRP